MIQPLLLLKQTLESPYNAGALLLSGPNLKFTSADQFLSGVPRADGARELTIEVEAGSDQIGIVFEKHPNSKLRVRKRFFPTRDKSQLLDSDRVRSVTAEGVTASFRRLLFGQGLASIIHIPGQRGSLQRTYPITTTGPRFQGTFDHYAASVISHWQADGSKEILNRLNHDLVDIGLTSRVVAQPINDTEIETLKPG
ncbi:MAG: hypothetical protein ACR2NN_14805 [Bryobacteraceae bacterium]